MPDSSARRFVILEHDHPYPHWDLLIESGDVLHAWRLSECPAPGRRIAAERIADHRPFYLNYEGPVSGNRGTVQRVCAGCLENETGEDQFRMFETTLISLRRCRREDVSSQSAGHFCWWVFE